MILHALWAIAINSLLIYLFGYLGLFEVSNSFPTYLITGVILGLSNAVIKPILKLLTLPIIFLTFGLFSLIINGVILWFTSYALAVLDFSGIVFSIISIEKFILATLLFSIINFLVQRLLITKGRKK